MKFFEFLGDDIHSLHSREEFFLKNTEDNLLSFSILENPSISISKMQNYADVDEEKATEDRVEIARRQTGGRFMYLDKNSLIISIAIPSKGTSPSDNYNPLCDLIISSLKELTGESFYVEYANDIMHSSGKKIGGAAQIKGNLKGESRTVVHSYIRYDADPKKAFKYCKLDGVSLENHIEELSDQIISIKQLSPDMAFSDFYNNFTRIFRKNLEKYVKESLQKTNLSQDQRQGIQNKRNTHLSSEYVQGKPNYPSRGHCDSIAGSGDKSVLKIRELIGKVTYS